MTRKAKAENWRQQRLHQAFLIRCWQQEGEWRFMLEDVSTRERQVFVDVAELVGWLTAVLDPPAGDSK